jgi:hypothetical protein
MAMAMATLLMLLSAASCCSSIASAAPEPFWGARPLLAIGPERSL